MKLVKGMKGAFTMKRVKGMKRARDANTLGRARTLGVAGGPARPRPFGRSALQSAASLHGLHELHVNAF
jgi:hypothetical protein